MLFETFDILMDMEKVISESHEIMFLKGFKPVIKKDFELLIDKLYAILPSDVAKARKFLQERQINIKNSAECNIYNRIKDLEMEMESSFMFLTYTIVKVKSIENMIDKIYTEIPPEMVKARNINS